MYREYEAAEKKLLKAIENEKGFSIKKLFNILALNGLCRSNRAGM